MGYNRAVPNEAPPAYRFTTRVYGRSLRPIIIALATVTAIWALAWAVSSFEELRLDDNNNLPRLAPLAIAQGVVYTITCVCQVFGGVAASLRRVRLIKLYAFLCALSALLVIGVSFMRVITHFVYKSDLITECKDVVQSQGSAGLVFGIWGLDSTTDLDGSDPTDYCNSQWSHDSWVEILTLVLVIFLGLFFTSLAFAYYRQVLDPTSPANASRVPSNQARGGNYPSRYDPPYDQSAYAPVYLPPPGPPPDIGKPPEYKPSSYLYGEDKDAKEHDPFSDFEGPSVPMPTHWVEDREATRL